MPKQNFSAMPNPLNNSQWVIYETIESIKVQRMLIDEHFFDSEHEFECFILFLLQSLNK